MGLHLDLLLGFRVITRGIDQNRYRVTTTHYFYSLLDENRRELIAYHYHPFGASWCTYPHLHAETTTGIISGKAHLVTERVALEAVIRMLIEDPSIPVTSLRADWPRVLEEKGDGDAVD